jgi:translocation and assembly module TamB
VLNGSGLIQHGADSGAGHGLQATIRFEGAGLKPSDPALAQAIGPQLAGQVALDWHRGDGKVMLKDLSLTAGDASLGGQGTISGLTTGLKVEGQFAANADDLTRFAALTTLPLAGLVRTEVSGWISPLSGQFDGDITIAGQDLHSGFAQADGLLAGVSSIQISAARDETGIAVRQFDIEAEAGLTASLSGHVATGGSDLAGSLALADLTLLNAGLSGGVSGQARFTGTLQDAHLTLTGTGTDIGLGQAQADALAKGTTALDLDLHVAGQKVTIAKADLSGPSARVTATGVFDPAGSDLSAKVALPNLAVLQLGYRGAVSGDLRLTGPLDALRAQVSAKTSDLAIGQVLVDRLLAGPGTLTADVQVNDRQRLQINALNAATPALSVKASGRPEALTVDARLTNLGTLLPEFPGPLTAQGSVTQSATGTGLDLTIRGPGQIQAQVTGSLAPGFASADLTARGTAQAGLANVLIAPRVMSGPVSFDLALRGPLAFSSISGTASLTGGRMADPNLPASLVGIAAQARLAGGTATVTMNTGISTGGAATVTGTVGLTPPMPANLAITLANVTLRDPQLYTVTMDGNLTFAGPALGGGKLAGSVNLSNTELRVPNASIASLPVLKDLKHKNDSLAVRQTRARAGADAHAARSGGGSGTYALDLLVTAPNQIFIRGRGLDAELGGQVRLTGTTAAIVPFGSFELIRGRLDLLGKRLVLSEATLQMQGALVPWVHVAATTRSDEFEISAVIEGDAFDPKVTFTSSPELPQEEVIARLLFNSGLQSLSPFQLAQLASAVATLSGRGGEGLLGKIRNAAGLVNLDVVADASGKASVTAGRYLTKNLYSELTVGQDGQSVLTLNLDVSRSITLRGTLDDNGNSSLGVVLEKDY